MTTRYEQLKNHHERINKQLEFDIYMNNLKQVIMRQTDYDEEIAFKKLVDYDLDVMKIVCSVCAT